MGAFTLDPNNVLFYLLHSFPKWFQIFIQFKCVLAISNQGIVCSLKLYCSEYSHSVLRFSYPVLIWEAPFFILLKYLFLQQGYFRYCYYQIKSRTSLVCEGKHLLNLVLFFVSKSC